MTDRRALFFLVASVLGFVLAPLAEPEVRWVAITVGVTYAVLAPAPRSTRGPAAAAERVGAAGVEPTRFGLKGRCSAN